jgi:hypothetical protein
VIRRIMRMRRGGCQKGDVDEKVEAVRRAMRVSRSMRVRWATRVTRVMRVRWATLVSG